MSGTPTPNVYVVGFNGEMRDELLNETLFFSLDHAREAVASWIGDYNTKRPHPSLAYETPAAYAAKLAITAQDFENCWIKVHWQEIAIIGTETTEFLT